MLTWMLSFSDRQSKILHYSLESAVRTSQGSVPRVWRKLQLQQLLELVEETCLGFHPIVHHRLAEVEEEAEVL